jgi:uncharacterized membrane protein
VSEKSQLAGVVAAGLLLGLIALAGIVFFAPLFDGDLTVSSYEAVLGTDGTLTEQYTFDVGSGYEYRMLYRIWEAPVTFIPLYEPHIRFVSLDPPPGTIGYVRDGNGDVTVYPAGAPEASRSTIRNLAYRNEVGIFNADYYPRGEYTARYEYVVNPPFETDGATTHLNLQLAGTTHIPYHHVRVTVPATGIDTVYAYPPSLETQKSGDVYVITGSVAADEILGIEMLGTTEAFSAMSGFTRHVDAVREEAASGAFWYNLPYYVASLLNWLGKIAVIIVPLLLVVVWHRYGREKEFTVPQYLSTLPGTALKPWQVNLLFKKDAVDFDEDGYYATLLDLHRRKNIRIEEKGEGKGLQIRVLSTDAADAYEQRVIAFITTLSENGVLDTDRIEKLTKQAQTISSAEETALRYQRSLADVTKRVDTTISGQYMVDGREHLLVLLLPALVMAGISLILALVAPMQSYLTFPALLCWVIVVVQVAIASAAPSTLFGHWKDDRYREKLEWDAFTNFLSDMAMIRKYAPADISMWGEWLVFGTALGVGDKVEAAMKSLNVQIPETGVPMGVVGMNYAFLPLMHFTPPSHGSSGGGGFGGGGLAEAGDSVAVVPVGGKPPHSRIQSLQEYKTAQTI